MPQQPLFETVFVDPDPVKGLLASRVAISKSAREQSARAKAAEEVTEAVAAGMAPEPTEADIIAARVQTDLLEHQLLLAGTSPAEEIARVRRDLVTWATDAQAMVDFLGQSAGSAPDPVLSQVQGMLSRVVQGGGSLCPCCGIAAAPEFFGDRLRDVTRVVESFAQIQAQRDAAQGRYNALKQQYESGVGYLTQLEARPVSSVTVEQAKAALDVERARFADLQTLKAKHESIRTSRSIATDAHRKEVEWKALAKEVDRVIAELLDASIAGFTTKVQRYLPAGLLFGLKLHGDVNAKDLTFEFGLIRGEDLHVALSGAEWTLVTLALAAAVSEGSALAILVPEDRALDPRTLRETLEVYSGFSGQVLVPSVIEPEGGVPPGWTVVRTGSRRWEDKPRGNGDVGSTGKPKGKKGSPGAGIGR